MSIRIIKVGTIKCDDCGKYLAWIRTSRQVMEVVEDEQKNTQILCANCREPSEEDLLPPLPDIKA
jgi:hypothetical protein